MRTLLLIVALFVIAFGANALADVKSVGTVANGNHLVQVDNFMVPLAELPHTLAKRLSPDEYALWKHYQNETVYREAAARLEAESTPTVVEQSGRTVTRFNTPQSRPFGLGTAWRANSANTPFDRETGAIDTRSGNRTVFRTYPNLKYRDRSAIIYNPYVDE